MQFFVKINKFKIGYIKNLLQTNRRFLCQCYPVLQKDLQNTLYVNLGSVRPKRVDKPCEHWCPLCHQSSVEEEISLSQSQVALQCLDMLWNDKSFHLSVIFLHFKIDNFNLALNQG